MYPEVQGLLEESCPYRRDQMQAFLQEYKESAIALPLTRGPVLAKTAPIGPRRPFLSSWGTLLGWAWMSVDLISSVFPDQESNAVSEKHQL